MRLISLFLPLVLVACAKPIPGPQGAPGVSVVGPQGIAGNTGQAGANGQDAVPCSVTKVGSIATITCPNGSVTIQDGQQGIPGQSITGPAGPQGDPGTTITSVQFCAPGFVPSYPNVFPEVGLCIDHQLYGVYSANGGFLVLLLPGNYSSNGINASCSFTIEANCEVTQ